MIHPHQLDSEDLSLASFNISVSSSNNSFTGVIPQEAKKSGKTFLDSQFDAQRNNPFFSSKLPRTQSTPPPLTQSHPVADLAPPSRVNSKGLPAITIFRNNPRIFSLKNQPKVVGIQKPELIKHEELGASKDESSIDMSFEFDRSTGDKILKLKLGLAHSGSSKMFSDESKVNHKENLVITVSCDVVANQTSASQFENEGPKFSKRASTGVGKITKISQNVILAESVKLDYCEGFQSLYEGGENSAHESKQISDPLLTHADQSTFFYDITGCEESKPLCISQNEEKRELAKAAAEVLLFDRSIKDFQPLVRSCSNRYGDTLMVQSRSTDRLKTIDKLSRDTNELFFKTEPAFSKDYEEEPSFNECKLRNLLTQQGHEGSEIDKSLNDTEISKILLLKDNFSPNITNTVEETKPQRNEEGNYRDKGHYCLAEVKFGLNSVSFRDNFIESSGNFARPETWGCSGVETEFNEIHKSENLLEEKKVAETLTEVIPLVNENCERLLSSCIEHKIDHCKTAFSQEIDKMITEIKLRFENEIHSQSSEDICHAEHANLNVNTHFNKIETASSTNSTLQNDFLKRRKNCPEDNPHCFSFQSKNALSNLKQKSKVLSNYGTNFLDSDKKLAFYKNDNNEYSAPLENKLVSNEKAYPTWPSKDFPELDENQLIYTERCHNPEMELEFRFEEDLKQCSQLGHFLGKGEDLQGNAEQEFSGSDLADLSCQNFAALPEEKCTSFQEEENTRYPVANHKSFPEAKHTSSSEVKRISSPEAQQPSFSEAQHTSIPEPYHTSFPEPQHTSLPDPSFPLRFTDFREDTHTNPPNEVYFNYPKQNFPLLEKQNGNRLERCSLIELATVMRSKPSNETQNPGVKDLGLPAMDTISVSPVDDKLTEETYYLQSINSQIKDSYSLNFSEDRNLSHKKKGKMPANEGKIGWETEGLMNLGEELNSAKEVFENKRDENEFVFFKKPEFIVPSGSPKLNGKICEEVSNLPGTPTMIFLEDAPSLILNSFCRKLFVQDGEKAAEELKEDVILAKFTEICKTPSIVEAAPADPRLDLETAIFEKGNTGRFPLYRDQSNLENKIGSHNSYIELGKDNKQSLKELSFPYHSSEDKEKDIDSDLRNDLMKIDQEDVGYWEIEKMISERSNTWHTNDDSENFKEKNSGLCKQNELANLLQINPEEHRNSFESPIKFASAEKDKGKEVQRNTSGQELKGTKIFFEGSISKILKHNKAENKENAKPIAPFTAFEAITEVLTERPIQENKAVIRPSFREETTNAKSSDIKKDRKIAKMPSEIRAETAQKKADHLDKKTKTSVKKLASKGAKQETLKKPDNSHSKGNERILKQPKSAVSKANSKADTSKKPMDSNVVGKIKNSVNAEPKAYKSEQMFKFRPAQVNYFETARKLNFILESSYSAMDNMEIETTPKASNGVGCSLSFKGAEVKNLKFIASESKNRPIESRGSYDLYSLYWKTQAASSGNPNQNITKPEQYVFNFLQEEY